jgi:hypothetical protein
MWQQEIDQKQAAMDKMVKIMMLNRLCLPDDLKKKREDEFIIKKKKLGICKKDVLVLKEICLKKGRN